MNRILLYLKLFVLSAVLSLLLPGFDAAGGWVQDDWSGGPGQASLEDYTRYSSSSRLDTMGVPGAIRLSYLSGPYTKDPANPIVPQGAAGRWDEEVISGYPRARDGGGYEMVYRGQDASSVRAVGYASSPDGINWTKYAGNLVLQKSAAAAEWEERGVGTGPRVEVDGTYHMFFRGYGPSGSTSNYYGHATSTDLINWTREENYVFGPGPAGSWDENYNYITDVVADSSFTMCYWAANAGDVYQVGRASSPDGVNWTRDPSNPVLPVGAAGSWDSAYIGGADLLERPWAGDYLMVYSASDGATAGIGTATSPDGVSWTKNPNNPLFT